MYDFKAENNQPVIYDCGANIGVSALYYKILYPGSIIKAFEADSNIADILKSNLNRNNIQGVEVINKAAWIDNNGVTFNVDNADGGSVYGEGNKIKVDSVRLRNLIASEEFIDLIKMNVEGAELDVIPDCEDVLSKVKNLYIEYHSFPKIEQKLDNILLSLKKNGFRYYIQNIVSPKRIPSVDQLKSESIDLQLHIFAYKSE
jgi:FkbM family methyltransferase